MKRILLLVLVAITPYFTAVHAAQKISVENGDWSNPATWSPAGVPLFEDTVIINTNVVASENIDVVINYLIVNEGYTLSSEFTFGLRGNLLNYGTIDIEILGIGDGEFIINDGVLLSNTVATGNSESFENNGVIEVLTLAPTEALFENYGTIKAETVIVAELFKNHQAIFCEVAFETNDESEFINEAGAALVTSSFLTYDDATNNGDVSAFGWTHEAGIVTGETGKFCIEDCFVNRSTIEGTIDICDASPSEMCDMQLGTIAASVTLCETSPCIENLSINSETQITEINVFPNPTNGIVTLDLSSLNKISSLHIYNMNGQSLMEVFDLSSSTYTIDLGNLAKGTYICQIQNEELIWQQLIVVH
jgi:hypothetical protein